MLDRLATNEEKEFASAVAGVRQQTIWPGRNEMRDLGGIRAIACKEGVGAILDNASRRREPSQPFASITGEVAPTTEGPLGSTEAALPAEALQRHVRGQFAEGTKGGPFPADHAEHRWAAAALDHRAEMVARDAAGKAVRAGGQRPHAGKLEDDLLRPDHDAGQHEGKRLQNVIALIRLAAHRAGVIDPYIRRADQHLAEIGKENADTPILVLIVDHMAIQHIAQAGIIDDKVRSLGAPHQWRGAGSFRKERAVGHIDPASGRIDDQCRLDFHRFAREAIAEQKFADRILLDGRVVQRSRISVRHDAVD